MGSKKDNSINKSSTAISRAFKKMHIVFFIIIISAGLVYAVLTLNDILQSIYANEAAGNPNQTQSNNVTLPAPDQTVISKLNALSNSDSAKVPSLPSGRVNPFTN